METVGVAKELVDFRKVIDGLEQGFMAKRSHWDKFIFMQVPSEVNKQFVSKMSSLPDTVKNHFESTFESSSEQIDAIYYKDQVAQVESSNMISAYIPSWQDIFAKDWIIL